MKNIRIKIDGCKDFLFDYPCVDSNSKFLQDKRITIITSSNIVDKSWFEQFGAEVLINPTTEEDLFSDICILMPREVDRDDEEGYYQVLDYYIQNLQLLIYRQKNLPGFKHLIVILPARTDECSSSLIRMAYYAVLGLVKGMGMMYASNGLFVNGIILNESDSKENLRDRLLLLSSNNSCNIVGQVFKL